jgi:hypothetical protein
VQGMYAGGPNHGFMIRDALESGPGAHEFTSREGLENQPQLVIAYG